MTISETRIATIGAQSLRWPAHETLQWQKMRDAVAAAQNAVRELDGKVMAIEADPDLNEAAKVRKAGEAAMAAIEALDSLPDYRTAARLVAEQIEKIEAKRTEMPKAPNNVGDAMLLAEIRAHVAKQDSPLAFAHNHRHDPRVLAAVSNAPAFLSGMSDEQHNTFVASATGALFPDEEARKKEHTDAIEVTRKAIETAKSIIGERGHLVKTPGGYEPRALKAVA